VRPSIIIAGITATMAAAKAVPVPAAPDVAKAALDLAAKTMVAVMTPVEVRTDLVARVVPVPAAPDVAKAALDLAVKATAAAMTPAEVRTARAARVVPAPAVKAVPAARVRPIDIDSLRAPWPHFLAGHGASGGNP
jgi:enoyl-[acyl-carrier-protein] reductase (NADH)